MSDERLLIIEDDKKMAALVRGLVTEMKFAVHDTSVKHLKEVYDVIAPEIIVLDILMPEMDGLQVLRFIKDRNIHPRIIILSGAPSEYRRMVENLAKAFGFPVDANIPKPFRLDELRSVLEKSRKELASAQPPDEASA